MGLEQEPQDTIYMNRTMDRFWMGINIVNLLCILTIAIPYFIKIDRNYFPDKGEILLLFYLIEMVYLLLMWKVGKVSGSYTKSETSLAKVVRLITIVTLTLILTTPIWLVLFFYFIT